MQASSGPSLDELKEKYIRSGLLKSRERTGGSRRYSIESEKRNSISRPAPNTRRLSSEPSSSRILSNRQNFRDIVLKAAEHKPFLERLNSSSRNRLAGLGHHARLQKFRHIASRWKNKTNIGIETLPEVDYEVEMPEKPRFCATLSTEAQYATLKGYEDVLVDKISSSLTSNANTVRIKRIPSAAPKPKSNSSKSSLPIIENQPNIVLLSSEESKEVGSSDGGESATSARLKSFRDQRYMSTHFKQAMNILDELKRCDSQEHAAATVQRDGNITVQNNIYRQYHAWSQRWAKQFEFSC